MIAEATAAATVWVLIVFGSGEAATTTFQEFNTQQKCEAALDLINSVSWRRTAACVEK